MRQLDAVMDIYSSKGSYEVGMNDLFIIAISIYLVDDSIVFLVIEVANEDVRFTCGVEKSESAKLLWN